MFGDGSRSATESDNFLEKKEVKIAFSVNVRRFYFCIMERIEGKVLLELFNGGSSGNTWAGLQVIFLNFLFFLNDQQVSYIPNH